jgi:hypothetical protein
VLERYGVKGDDELEPAVEVAPISGRRTIRAAREARGEGTARVLFDLSSGRRSGCSHELVVGAPLGSSRYREQSAAVNRVRPVIRFLSRSALFPLLAAFACTATRLLGVHYSLRLPVAPSERHKEPPPTT